MDEKKFIYRIFDVNLNRASEGLRVIEEYVRFYSIDISNLETIRNIRHKLSRLLEKDYLSILSFRNIKEDLGREIKEDNRKNFLDILLSNFKRVEEALRVLEEYAKYPYFINENINYNDFKQLRFVVYDLEKKICLDFSPKKSEKIEKKY